MRRVLFLAAVFSVAAFTAKAQDPVKVDPKHYKVEFENDQVRVIRITYGPHEKSVMHSHPAQAGAFLTDADFKFTYPDGKTEHIQGKAGQVMARGAYKHLPENLSDKPFEAVFVELKGKPVAGRAAEIQLALDPVKVDPKHYRVEFENAQVRVLRIYYGPHEKSVMHEHPPGVAVFLTDEHVRITFPDGKTEDRHLLAGQTRWAKGEKHLPENPSDKAWELILVELKAKAKQRPSAPAAKKKS